MEPFPLFFGLLGLALFFVVFVGGVEVGKRDDQDTHRYRRDGHGCTKCQAGACPTCRQPLQDRSTP